MHVLVVEPNPATTGLLEKHLVNWQHTVAVATTVDQAVAKLEATAQACDVVIASAQIQEVRDDGFCRRIRSLNPNHFVYFLMIHDPADAREAASHCIEGRMDDCMAGPPDPNTLRVKMGIAERIVALEREVNLKLLTIRRNYYQSVNTLTQLIELANEDIGAHCRRVGQLALALAKRHPGIAAEDYPVIEAAGMLHDIGIIGLPRHILTKRRTELTGNENALYRTHPQRGEKILNQIDLLKPVARIVRMHHEQPNGRGFPDGLKSDRIPPAAAVVSAASIYDNLVHRGNLPLQRIPQHLQQFKGYQLRPDLVDLLLEVNLHMIQDEVRATDHAVLIDDLKKGMILAREVHMKSGAFFMAAETILEDRLIERLKQYREMGNITHKVFIQK
jgi:putative two-component system response regulator